MKERYLRFLALVLALVMLLCGCTNPLEAFIQQAEMIYDTIVAFDQVVQREDAWQNTNEPLSQMVYTRPDMQMLEQVLQESCQIAREETDLETVMDAVYDYYDIYDRFDTDLALADIHYCCDVTDIYWQ